LSSRIYLQATPFGFRNLLEFPKTIQKYLQIAAQLLNFTTEFADCIIDLVDFEVRVGERLRCTGNLWKFGFE
jgi:hypothetical protein